MGPATHPARSWNVRPLSCSFDFPRDNVEWSEEQAAAAERKVRENSTQRVCQEKQGAPRCGPSMVAAASVPVDTLSPRGQRPRPPRAFVTGLIPNSGVGWEGQGMGKDGKGLHPKSY